MPSRSSVVRKDGPGGRFYEVPDCDHPLPSVTHILSVIAKPALVNWAANTERALVLDAAADLYLDLLKCQPMSRPAYLTTLASRVGKTKAHQRELAKAGEIGTQAHQLIEWNLRRTLLQKVGPEPRVTDAAQWAFMAWQDWASSVDLKPIYIEQAIWSLRYGYAGTMDLYAEVAGVPTLVDWKTGKAVYAEAHLQNAAYRVALREMGHGEAVGGLIVRLPKVETDPAFEVVECPPVAEVFDTFLSALTLWKWWYAQDQAYRDHAKASKAVADA